MNELSQKFRVLYVQYTNPGAYPPLQHSSRILANLGGEVLFLGTGSRGTNELRFPRHANIQVKQVRFCPGGWLQKLHYTGFAVWVFFWNLRWRPSWIYASDVLSCPVALLLSFLPGRLILYHEHDSPMKSERSSSAFEKLLIKARRKLAHRAHLCVLPNEKRAERFRFETSTTRPVLTVWNCPALEDATKHGRAHTQKEFVVFFHGSIVPARLPMSTIEALARLPDEIMLRVAGYETIGHVGYSRALQSHARRLGISDRLSFLGAFERRSLLDHCRQADVGLAFMPPRSEDVNERAMTGASNKPFDYLACGLALLVSDLPDWRTFFVEPGYGLACNPEDPESIARAIRWFFDHPDETRSMGSRGRDRVLTEWNYEQEFQRVLSVFKETATR